MNNDKYRKTPFHSCMRETKSSDIPVYILFSYHESVYAYNYSSILVEYYKQILFGSIYHRTEK